MMFGRLCRLVKIEVRGDVETLEEWVDWIKGPSGYRTDCSGFDIDHSGYHGG